jgi:hypothetical protein
MTAFDDRAFRERLRRIEALIGQWEAHPDPVAREAARELTRALLDLHAVGLARVLELADPAVVDRLAHDGLAGALLQLHGLHPWDVGRRVARALDRLRPRLHALGGDAELFEAAADRVRVQLRGEGAMAAELRRLVEEALDEAAPDAAAVEIEEAWQGPPPGRIPLPLLGSGPGPVGGAPGKGFGHG